MEPENPEQHLLAANSMEFDSATGAISVAPRGVLPLKPKFAALTAREMDEKVQFSKVSVPPHRYSTLKKNWMEIYTPIYDHMKIDILMNLKVLATAE